MTDLLLFREKNIKFFFVGLNTESLRIGSTVPVEILIRNTKLSSVADS
jgi:hypothetical protein